MNINRNRKLICPICTAEIPFVPQKISTHLKMCAKKESCSYKDIRTKFLLLNWPELDTKEKFEKEYNNLSIPGFAEKYGVSNPLEFCDIFSIPHRSIQEANKSDGLAQRNIKKAVQEKYGVSNVLSKGSPFYEKRNNTVRDKYGVDNVFQRQDIVDKLHSDEFYLEKYNMTYKDFRSASTKRVWAKLSDIEKEAWLKKSLWSNASTVNLNKRTFNTSSYELKILSILFEQPLHVVSQFMIKKYNRSYFSYDIYIEDLNLLIEVNGDYWHANPVKYKSGDIIRYPGHEELVDNIWKKDSEKRDLALEKGFNFVVLWTEDIKNINTFEDLMKAIEEKMVLP